MGNGYVGLSIHENANLKSDLSAKQVRVDAVSLPMKTLPSSDKVVATALVAAIFVGAAPRPTTPRTAVSTAYYDAA